MGRRIFPFFSKTRIGNEILKTNYGTKCEQREQTWMLNFSQIGELLWHENGVFEDLE